MADKIDKNPLNVSGKYYNDTNCIDCDLCREIAPQIFTRDDNEGLSYAHRQPVTEAEITLAEEALNSCPTESIGNDG
ncbi:MAG: ferredoxin [Verrucomicrobia bacterium]|nr:MAG: ferredoxin [Verrucomicrobiota bacterium]